MYRDLLVHLKSYENWSAHIDAALALAARSNAYVTGLLTLQEIAIVRLLETRPNAGGELLRKIEDDARNKTAEMKARFDAALAKHGVNGAFEAAEGRANDLLTLAGRFHDLVIIEQTDPAHDEMNWTSAEEAAVHSARPTLIVPNTGDFTRPFARILVAWNGSREATRALHAASPLLAAAEHVLLLEGEPRDTPASVTRAPSLDISVYLKRRAKNVEVAGRMLKDADAASSILSAAHARQCDAIVMGAYGRAGLSRLILGGATARVFREAEIPILTAH